MELPLEIVEEILLFAQAEELNRFSQTCSLYRGLCQDLSFWKKKFRREGLPLYVLQDYPQETYLQIYSQTLSSIQSARNVLQELTRERERSASSFIGYRILLKNVKRAEQISINGNEESLSYHLKQTQFLADSMRRMSTSLFAMETASHLSFIAQHYGYPDISNIPRKDSIFLPVIILQIRPDHVDYYIESTGVKSEENEISYEDLADLIFRSRYYALSGEIYYQ